MTKIRTHGVSIVLLLVLIIPLFMVNNASAASYDVSVEVSYLNTTKDWDGPGSVQELWNQIDCKDSNGNWRGIKSTGNYRVLPEDNPYTYDEKDKDLQRLIVDLTLNYNNCHDIADENDIRFKIFEDDVFGGDDDVTHWIYADFASQDTSSNYWYKTGSGNSPDATSYSYSVTWKVWW